MFGHIYTPERVAFLREHSAVSRSMLTRMFNRRFGTDISENAIKAACHRRAIKTGRTGCFPPGNRPYNTGIKGLTGANATSFKAGSLPHNWVPVGTEVVESKDGYTKVKTAEPKTWRFKHTMVWEKHNGPLPVGMVVIFADRNKGNFDPDNLIAVSRRQLAYLNLKHMIHPDKELTKTAVNIVKLMMRVNDTLLGGRQ